MTATLDAFSAALDQSLRSIKPAPASLIFEASDDLNPQSVANALMMGGVAMVRGFIPSSDVQHLKGAVDEMWKAARDTVHRNATTETDDYVVNYALERFTRFPELLSYRKPIFNLRHARGTDAPDAGFVDVFKPEILVPALAPWRAKLETGLPHAVISRLAGARYEATSFHLYINEGTATPRDFHIDAEVHQVKAFVYLTDVNALDDGPYCYAPGTHQERHIKALNKIFNEVTGRPQTDMSLVDPALAIACLAPAGTLILSYQSGAHRGYPQAPHARRLMLAELFEPASP